jgi:hypothetical protein
MLTSVFQQHQTNTMPDETISRFIHFGIQVHKAANSMPMEILSV